MREERENCISLLVQRKRHLICNVKFIPVLEASFVCAVGGLSTAGSTRGQVQLLSVLQGVSVAGVRICLQSCGSGELNNAGKTEGFEEIVF